MGINFLNSSLRIGHKNERKKPNSLVKESFIKKIGPLQNQKASLWSKKKLFEIKTLLYNICIFLTKKHCQTFFYWLSRLHLWN